MLDSLITGSLKQVPKYLKAAEGMKCLFSSWSLISCAMDSYLCIITTNDAMYWKWFVTNPSICQSDSKAILFVIG